MIARACHDHACVHPRRATHLMSFMISITMRMSEPIESVMDAKKTSRTNSTSVSTEPTARMVG